MAWKVLQGWPLPSPEFPSTPLGACLLVPPFFPASLQILVQTFLKETFHASQTILNFCGILGFSFGSSHSSGSKPTTQWPFEGAPPLLEWRPRGSETMSGWFPALPSSPSTFLDPCHPWSYSSRQPDEECCLCSAAKERSHMPVLQASVPLVDSDSLLFLLRLPSHMPVCPSSSVSGPSSRPPSLPSPCSAPKPLLLSPPFDSHELLADLLGSSHYKWNVWGPLDVHPILDHQGREEAS